MAVRKYLKVDTTDGRTKEEAAVNISNGPADEGRIPALDSGGKLDLTMMPTGIGPDLKSLPVGVDVTAGNFVTVYDDLGTLKVKPAKADNSAIQADGFVKETVTVGNPVNVYFEGVNDQVSGHTPGTRVFLSAATAGAATATPPTGSGHVLPVPGQGGECHRDRL
ncbi:MAG: hypothetical protein HQL76_18100 [Magnetococcales bacterium]|nr:hypothetical protein [Magnetococcales bacterium]